MRGHQTLRAELTSEPIGYVGRRHTQRIISDSMRRVSSEVQLSAPTCSLTATKKT